MVHRREERGEVDLSPEQARRVLRDHENDLDDRVFITHRAIEWMEALRLAERLSAAHTASEGFRSFDLFHVGTALAFRCGEFYSFDTAARRMAALAGLKVLPTRVG